MKLLTFSLLVAAAPLQGFGQITTPDQPQSEPGMVLSGVMHHTNIEGGCWYLKSDNGKQYELTGDSGLVNSLRVDGRHVTVRAIRVKGGASVCMVGELVRVQGQTEERRMPYDPPVMTMMVTGRIHHTKTGIWYVKTSQGETYEFQNSPEKKFQKVGARVHEQLKLMLTKTSHGMSGAIMNDAPKQVKHGRIMPKYNDPR